jgi:hypothetical protein
MTVNLLSSIPNFVSQNKIDSWIKDKTDSTTLLDINKEKNHEVVPLMLNEKKCTIMSENNTIFNKFVLAILLADWVCYNRNFDRENYVHLRTVVSKFPDGFRVWFAQIRGEFIPVGYTGIHPIAKRTFYQLQDFPETITNRGQIFPKEKSKFSDYWYLYNCSVIRQFHKTYVSKLVVETLAKDIGSSNKRGMSAIVVSPDGQRLVEKFGLHRSGYITHDGHKEESYVKDYFDQTAANLSPMPYSLDTENII